MTQRGPDFWMDLRGRLEALAGAATPVWAKRMPDNQWILGGGRDKAARELVGVLCVQAAIAAKLGGDPLGAWLNALTNTAHHKPDRQVVAKGSASLEYVDLEDVPAASIVLVTQHESASMRPPQQPARFVKRAQWVRDRMTQLSIDSPWALEVKHGGPDQSSARKVLDGKPVTDKTLNKLAKALQVTRADIPND